MTSDEIKRLDELLMQESGLSPWEVKFVCSLDEQRDKDLTPKQRECLIKISDKL